MNSITTPRSPAFEEYRQQVDTLTNQIRSQLSQVRVVDQPMISAVRGLERHCECTWSDMHHSLARICLYVARAGGVKRAGSVTAGTPG